MDNAANNLVAMRELTKLLKAHEIPFTPLDHCIPCFPHMINICITHIVKGYTTANFANVAATWVGVLKNVINKNEYLQALTTDPVTLGHNIVHIIRVSDQCCKGFRDTIINGNANQWYTGDETQVLLVELLSDVQSCWDLIYFMINQLCALPLVSHHYS